jgi:hypothetical protein
VRPDTRRHRGDVDEEEGIYRSEVMDILGALADISSDTLQILAILRGEDDEEDDDDEEVDA